MPCPQLRTALALTVQIGGEERLAGVERAADAATGRKAWPTGGIATAARKRLDEGEGRG